MAHKNAMAAKLRIPPKPTEFFGLTHVRGSSRSIPMSPPRIIAKRSPIKSEESIRRNYYILTVSCFSKSCKIWIEKSSVYSFLIYQHIFHKKRALIRALFGFMWPSECMKMNWSHHRDLNPRPHPYHGCALPAELWRLMWLVRSLYGRQGKFKVLSVVYFLVFLSIIHRL